jgi:hypothetical protein
MIVLFYMFLFYVILFSILFKIGKIYYTKFILYLEMDYNYDWIYCIL